MSKEYIICDRCRNKSILIKEYGDGYIEPKEKIYLCENCGTKVIHRQDTGWEYEEN